MGDLFAGLIRTILDWIKRNYKKPKMWVIIALFIVLVFWLIPYIDSYFFYYDRMEKRISILQQLTELDQEKMGANIILQKEYDDILKDIQLQEERMVSSIIENISNAINNIFNVKPQEGNVWIKFFAGASIAIIIAVCIPFMNTFSSRKEKIVGWIMVVIIACILGGINVIIPTIIHPYVNYWGMPIAQVIGLVVLATKSRKTDNKKEK